MQFQVKINNAWLLLIQEYDVCRISKLFSASYHSLWEIKCMFVCVCTLLLECNLLNQEMIHKLFFRNYKMKNVKWSLMCTKAFAFCCCRKKEQLASTARKFPSGPLFLPGFFSRHPCRVPENSKDYVLFVDV